MSTYFVFKIVIFQYTFLITHPETALPFYEHIKNYRGIFAEGLNLQVICSFLPMKTFIVFFKSSKALSKEHIKDHFNKL